MKWIHSLLFVALIATVSASPVRIESCNHLACGLLIGVCAVPCVDPLDGICELCLGGSFAECHGCFGDGKADSRSAVKDEMKTLAKHQVETESCNHLACGLLIGVCAVPCVDPLDGLCELCLGGSFATCHGCFGDGDASSQSAVKDQIRALSNHQVKTESCNHLACGLLIGVCAVPCVDPLDGICELCLGGSFAECHGCFGDGNADSQSAVKDEIRAPANHQVKTESCNHLACGLLIGVCAVPCVDPVDGICELCLGGSFATCHGCFGDGNADSQSAVKDSMRGLGNHHAQDRPGITLSKNSL